MYIFSPMYMYLMCVFFYRLIEEIKSASDVTLDNDMVYMAPVFEEFVTEVILRKRGGGQDSQFEYDAVSTNIYTMHRCKTGGRG